MIYFYGDYVGFLDFIFGKKSPKYKSLENWLSGKIKTGSEEEVLKQLEKIKKEIKDEKKKKGFEKYIKSKAWKKMFVK